MDGEIKGIFSLTVGCKSLVQQVLVETPHSRPIAWGLDDGELIYPYN